MGRPIGYISLPPEEEAFLKDFVKKGETKSREQNRARTLLWNAANKSSKEISALLTLGYGTVTQTLKDYRDGGLESALYDAHRCGAPRKITPEIEAQVTALACSTCPEGRVRWTIDLLSDELVRLHTEEILGAAPAQETVTVGDNEIVNSTPAKPIGRSSVHSILKKVNSSLGNIKCGVLGK